MLRSGRAVLDRLQAARDRASGGQPVVLIVEGEAGVGKSTVLQDLTQTAGRFRVIAGSGMESGASTPYRTLEQWLGVAVPAGISPLLAAQRLREMLDDRPTLLVLDDLHWADSESVEAVLEVVSRVDGDKLLVAVGTRPLAAQRHVAWQRWCRQSPVVEQLPLGGLTLEESVQLLRGRHPALSFATVQALWEHTGGNPLHLLAVAAEHAPGELARTPTLPAPQSFAATVAAVLQRLPADAVSVARALAVLGERWQPFAVVAEVAQVDHVAGPVQLLLDAELAEVRPDAVRPMTRLAHALIRAAVYQHIDLPLRRQLHGRAATVVGGEQTVLEHRIAAAQRFDDALADDLEGLADRFCTTHAYRQAARYRAAASDITADRRLREQRWLESLFDALIAAERRFVRDELAAIADATDLGRRALVTGILLIWERDFAGGLEALGSAGDPADLDPLTAHRIDVMEAWSHLMLGHPEPLISAALDRARAYSPPDPALQHLAILTEGQLAGRHLPPDDVLALANAIPSDPRAVPVEDTPGLRWRGVLRAAIGQFTAAAADLSELAHRMHKGQAEFSSGAYHAMMASCQWYAGDRSMARLNMRLARDLSGEFPHPVVAALSPLVAIGENDLDAADAMLSAAHALIDPAPWVEAVAMLSISDVVREHADGRARPVVFESFRVGLEQIRTGCSQQSVVWCLHGGVAAVWAGAFHDVETCIDVVQAAADRTTWGSSVANWLRGLLAEARGDGKTALSQLRTAVTDAPGELPLYAAHMHLDLSRLAHMMGDPTTATRAQSAAEGAYRRLGADGYVDRVQALKVGVPAQRAGPTLGLTDRERDVLTLVIAGLSYKQISSTLFITQSTVGFHLGRIYAKTNVKSRHQLTQLARSDPAALGLT